MTKFQNQSSTDLLLRFFSLIGLVMLVFWGHYNFLNFDDNVYITENPHVLSGLHWQNIRWAFTTSTGGHWHPLTWLSHQLDCQIFSLDSTAQHLENIFIHGLNTALLFTLLFKLFRNTGTAWLLAALFAVHPLRIESVIWITERKDVLSMCFGLLTLLAYVKFRNHQNRVAFLVILITFSLALLSKPSVVVLPVLLVLMDLFIFHLKNYKELLLKKIPFFALACISGLATLFSQHQAGALKSVGDLSLYARFSTAFVGYLSYLGKTFWPTKLCIFYPLVSYSPALTIGAFLILVFISYLCFRKFTHHPYIAFIWSWFLISLFPVIGILQVGGQSMADRWTYWPHVGLAIGFCGLIENLKADSKEKNRRFIYGALIVLIAMSIFKTRIELPHWKDSESLFTHALEVSPDNFLAHTNLGATLAAKGDFKSAQFHDEEAIRLNPTYTEALNNLGTLKARQGHPAEAIPLLLRSLARSPENSISRYNLGLAYYDTGQKLKAINEWLSLVILEPEYKSSWQSLSYAVRHDFTAICEMRKQNNPNSEIDFERMMQLFEKWKPQANDPALTQSMMTLRQCLITPDN